jgi:hypothetical protein
MQVTAHDRARVEAGGEHLGKFEQPVLDPLLAVLEAAAGQIP